MEERKGNILVIDDELGPRESIRIVLSGEHNCTVAEGGEHGLRLLEETPVDLVILDIKMPGLDGIETLKRIRDKRPDVMVILLTGYGTLETAQEAIRFGALDYLKKPFDIQELRDVVRRGLKKKFDAENEQARYDGLEKLIDKMRGEMANFDRMSKLGTLSAGIVHEMKNPLTVILGYTQMILSTMKESEAEGDLKLSGKSAHYLGVIERETIHCAEIAKKLLSISKASAEEFNVEDLREILSNTEVLVAPQCSVNQISIEKIQPEEPLNANVIQSQIHDILLNLSINAIHAIGKDGKVTLRSVSTGKDLANLLEVSEEEREYVGGQSTERFAAIEVEDSGTGIPEEYRERIFEPFFTTKKGEAGTGLGLPVSKEKAEKNSGHLGLVRTGPQGTMFRLLLPLS